MCFFAERDHSCVSCVRETNKDAKDFQGGNKGRDKVDKGEKKWEQYLWSLAGCEDRDSEDVAKREEQHMLIEAEQALKDDLERMIAQEVATKAIDDAIRQAFEEENKKAAQTTSINKLNIGRPSVSTSNSPLVKQIPIDASTLPNADLPIDPNMPDLEDDSNIFPNDDIFSGAYDDKDVGAEANFNNMDNIIDVSLIPTLRVHKDHHKGQILGDPKSTKVWILVDLPFGKKAIGTKWVFRNKRDERSIIVKNKARLVAQGFRQEEGIDYDEVFAPVAMIEAIRLFLAFMSFMGFLVYQMDVKSAFLYGTIEDEVYVHQPPGFVDTANPNKVYKVKQQPGGIFISQDKYVADILKKFDFCSIKTATTPIVSNKPLVKDEDGVDVDVHIYRSMSGSLMYLTTSRPETMFVVCTCARFQVTLKGSHLNAVKRIFRRLISWQCKKQTIMANSTTEAEYVAAANCCGQANLVLSSIFGAARQIWCYQANLILPGKFGAVRQIWCCRANLVLSRKFDAARQIWCCQANLVLLGKISMVYLEFVDQHNIVTCLEKIKGNSDFHEIVDFLASSSIHHALTVSPPIYTSYIEQFWNTASSQTVNDVKQINATIDSKAVVVIEVSIRSSLLFNDADGTA
ncbi:putative ribonuclease H-like domain-containing protein [Tanacetum coccineum]